MTRTRVLTTGMVSAAAVGLLWPTAAAADQGYQTQEYPVMAVEDAPPARGSVINIHANGPVIYGQERYSLLGAAPSTTYQVILTLYGDLACTTPILDFPTAELTTNAVGNGHAKGTFYAQDVAPLVPVATSVRGAWTFSDAEGVAYTTGCQLITLDVPRMAPGNAQP